VHQSLTDSGLRSTSAIVEESYMHGNSRNSELVPGLATVGSEDTADAVDYEESELLKHRSWSGLQRVRRCWRRSLG